MTIDDVLLTVDEFEARHPELSLEFLYYDDSLLHYCTKTNEVTVFNFTNEIQKNTDYDIAYKHIVTNVIELRGNIINEKGWMDDNKFSSQHELRTSWSWFVGIPLPHTVNHTKRMKGSNSTYYHYRAHNESGPAMIKRWFKHKGRYIKTAANWRVDRDPNYNVELQATSVEYYKEGKRYTKPELNAAGYFDTEDAGVKQFIWAML